MPDGNCLFHAVLAQLRSADSVDSLRTKMLRELKKDIYKDWSTTKSTGSLTYRWNSDLADIAPVALANVLRRTFFIIYEPRAYYIHPEGSGITESPIYLYLNDSHYQILIPNETFLQWEDQWYDFRTTPFRT